jgi:membrane-associated phospholipid phosphatase
VSGLWELDQSLFRAIHLDGHRDWLDPLFFVISSTGLGWVQSILILAALPWRKAMARTPRRLVKGDLRPLTGPLLLTLALASLINTAFLKKAIPRERPSNLPDALPQETFFHNSFPSGHTATSFAIAAALFWLTRGTSHRWVGPAALAWAALVGLSRIYRGVHWPTDVLGGALVGIGSAALVAMLLPKDRSPEGGHDLGGS